MEVGSMSGDVILFSTAKITLEIKLGGSPVNHNFLSTYPLRSLDSNCSGAKLDCLDSIFHLDSNQQLFKSLHDHHYLEEATLWGEGVRATIVLRPTD